MVFLSLFLEPRVNRIVNIVVALVYAVSIIASCPGLAACDQAGLPAAVETSNEANCRLYERLGFQAAGDQTAPDGGLRVWVLVRPPQR